MDSCEGKDLSLFSRALFAAIKKDPLILLRFMALTYNGNIRAGVPINKRICSLVLYDYHSAQGGKCQEEDGESLCQVIVNEGIAASQEN